MHGLELLAGLGGYGPCGCDLTIAMRAGSGEIWRWLQIDLGLCWIVFTASGLPASAIQQREEGTPETQPSVVRGANEVEVIQRGRTPQCAPAVPPTAQPSVAPAVDVGSPAPKQEKPSSVNTAKVTSEQSFLNLASREVEHYIDAFADLTADETRVMTLFDDRGRTFQERTTQSALVVYRLRNDPRSVVEYREVTSMDGHEVKGHAARAAKLWRVVSGAHSAKEEIRRIQADSERYDIGMVETGITLFEGLPLRPRCASDFAFREVRQDVAHGHQVRIFTYRQVHPCGAVPYFFDLPRRFADSPLLQAGELELDAATGQVVVEERNVFVGSLDSSIRVSHVELDYGESPFGILVPKTIVIETFLVPENINGTDKTDQLRARMVQTYGQFSRFEVSAGETVTPPAH